jgi:hypothetical protein
MTLVCLLILFLGMAMLLLELLALELLKARKAMEQAIQMPSTTLEPFSPHERL